MQLSEHFSLEEAITSETASRQGINNNPSGNIIIVMTMTAMQLEKVRALLGQPMHIDSWYRCPDLNAAVGSKPTSQHLKGEAIDFICPAYGTPTDIVKYIIANVASINYDQIILEHTWVHISWNSDPSVPQRNQVLSLLSNGGYAHGVTDVNGVSI